MAIELTSDCSYVDGIFFSSPVREITSYSLKCRGFITTQSSGLWKIKVIASLFALRRGIDDHSESLALKERKSDFPSGEDSPVSLLRVTFTLWWYTWQ